MEKREHSPTSQRGFSWFVAGFLLLALFINYIDRQTLSVLVPFLPPGLQMSNIVYGRIQSLFLLAYALAMPFAGWTVDRLGTRIGLSVTVAVWSIIEMLHGTARTVTALGTYRFLLGIPEAAALPAVSKVAAEHAAPHARATMIGIAMFGLGMGSTLAPPIVAYVSLHLNWSWAFYTTGLAGLVWVLFWSTTYRPEPAALTSSRVPVAWPSLLRDRRAIGLTLARAFADSTWWVYLFWIPPFLAQTRGVDLHQMGFVGWIPYFLASIGSVFGGYSSGFLVRRGWDPMRARSTIMWFAASVVLVTGVTTGFVLNTAGVAATIILLGLATFFIQAFFANIFSLPADLFPPEKVASVFGLNAMAGGLGGFFCVQAAGYMVERFSFVPVFTAVAFFLPMAALCTLVFVRPALPITDAPHADPSLAHT
jgi:ACS family hexuronate transporter-like MFS transporter